MTDDTETPTSFTFERSQEAELKMIHAEERAERALQKAEERLARALDRLDRAEQRVERRKVQLERARAELLERQLHRAAGPAKPRREIPDRTEASRPAKDSSPLPEPKTDSASKDAESLEPV